MQTNRSIKKLHFYCSYHMVKTVFFDFDFEISVMEKSSVSSTGPDQIGILEEGAPSLIETTIDSVQDQRDAQHYDHFQQRLEITDVFEKEVSKMEQEGPDRSKLLSETVNLTLPADRSVDHEKSSVDVHVEEPEIPPMSPVLAKDISHVTSSDCNQSKAGVVPRENISSTDSLSHTTLGSLNSTLGPPTMNLNVLSPKITQRVLTTSYLDPIVSIGVHYYSL